MRPSCLVPVAATLAAARSLAWPRADDSSPAPVWRHHHPRVLADAAPDASLSKSVYHIIAESERGRRFTELLKSHGELHERLTDDNQNLTVFVPVDDAFRRLNGLRRGDDDDDDDDETSVREVLEYHVLPGRFSLDDVAEARTLSTMLEEGDMGGRAQRLRVGGGLSSGVEINFYSRVIRSESIVGANGIVHFVGDVLAPPPRHDRLIGASPERCLGTFAKALRRSGVSEELRGSLGGVTVFAPTDKAWEALGTGVNEFLFSEEGRGYLDALASYHVLAGGAVYTDDMEDVADGETGEISAASFPTMLAGASLSARSGPLRRLGADEGLEAARDVPARDGVVHVLDEVLFPPGPGVDGSLRGGVEEARRRLDRFVNGFESYEL